MELILYTANVTAVPGNCLYPNRRKITCEREMAEAVAYDHVCASYKGNYRSNENFLESSLAVWDCDNDHSNDPADWITPEILGEGKLADVAFVCVPSRHNMIPKDGRSARPRFHLFAVIPTCRDVGEYTAIKTAVQKQFSFFDNNALDAARFLFGCRVKEEDVYWHDGWLTIDEVIPHGESKSTDDPFDGAIQQGSRNNTMSHFAGRILKRYGVTDKAKDAFLSHATRCDPPLPDEELDKIWASAVRFYRSKIEVQEGYVSPDDYNADFEAGNLKPDDYSDIGEAKVLAREYGDELIYTSATDYLRYDGDCWRENAELALGAVEEFLDLQLEDAKDEMGTAYEALKVAGIPESVIQAGGASLKKAATLLQGSEFEEYEKALAYHRFVLKYRNYKNIVATQNAAKPMLAVDVNQLDQNPNLINTPAATYDMALGLDGEKPHDPADLITKMTACSPGEEGKSLWQESLDLFFCGNQDLVDYVQLTVGLAAIGHVHQEFMIIAYGSGANGKSSFWNSVHRVLGDYGGTISADALTVNCKRNVRAETAELKGKRLIIASEMEEGMRLNTATVKQLCSTDAIQAEKKYKAPFSFTPSHTLVLYTNHLPRVGANDEGIWRRLIVIPFNAKITGRSEIKNYADYLVERAGPAIMAWIIEGAQKAIKAGYQTKPPKVVQDAICAYREENNWLGHFLSDCCEIGEGYTEKSGELYQAYRAYCLRTGEYTRSTTDFYGALEKIGHVRRRSNKGNLLCGLKLHEGQDFIG